MKRIPLLLTIGFLLVLSSGIFYFSYFVGRGAIQIWDVIPSQTILVYEVGECKDCIENIRSTSFFQTIQHSFTHARLNDSTDKLFSIVFDPKNNGIVSLHLTQNDDFDFIFFLSENGARSGIQELNRLSEKNPKTNQREFKGIQMHEINLKGEIFSWASFEKFWVGSFTPVLIEDVIRTYKSEEEDSFKGQLGEVYQLPKIKNDAGNIYLNLNSIDKFLSMFLEKNNGQSPLGNSALLDIKRSEKNITLNGFSLVGANTSGSLFSYFDKQTPVPFRSKQYISTRTLVATNYGISDGLQLYNNLDLSTNKSVQDSLTSFAKVDFNALFSSLGKEMSVCLFESRGTELSRILVFDVTNPEIWLSTFDALSKVAEKGDSIYFEKYSTYEIREIGIKNFPEKLFKPLVNGFDQTYYSSIGSTIVISDRVEELRRFLDDIDKEEVWGKSVSFNQFLESTLLESNISIYVNTPRALSAISSKLNPRWRKIYSTTGRNSLASLGFSAFQFSHLNESFYTNITWAFDSDVAVRERNTAANRIQTSINQPILSQPFVVKNHLTRKNEVLVQDSLFTLHYFSFDGKRQWKKDISGKIVDQVYQVDYLKNNKLQLFFVANNKIHVIDRLGNYVNPFPVSITQQNIEFVSVIDYDNSKKYRFLLADKSGKLWLFDKEGRMLDGWKPKNIEGPLFSNSNHHRLRGKDFILALRKDGWAYLMTRRGENVRGFPLNLDVRCDGDYFVESGNTLSTTYFVIVSRDGTKVKFNVEGKIVSREALVKAAVDDQFSLIAEKNHKSYIVKRQNSKQLTVFDEGGNIILTNDFTGSNEVNLQYYDFGSGLSFVVLSDPVQQLSYVYDGRGSLLTPVPLQGTDLSLMQDDGKVLNVFINGQSLMIEPLPN